MKSKRGLLLLILVAIILPASGFAQQSFTGFNYQVSIPLSDTKNFTKDASFRGFGLDFRKMTRPNMSIGLSLNWNVFHTVTSELISLQNVAGSGANGDINGNQNRVINAFPLLATTHFYVTSQDDKYVPFIGLGTGATFVKQRLELGTFILNDDTWHFTLAPEAGIGIQVGYDVHAVIAIKYNYAFSSGGFQHSYIALNLGVYYF